MPPLIETLFQLPESIFPTPLKLYSAGITHPDPNYRIHREKPNLTVLEYIVSGEGHLVIDGRRYHIKAGDVYLLHPFTDQDYASDRLNPWEKIWFNLNGDLVKNLIDAYQLKDLTHFKQCPLEAEFRAALEIVRQRRPDAYTELALALHRIFAGMNEWRQQHPESRLPFPLPDHPHLPARLADNAVPIHPGPALSPCTGIPGKHGLQNCRNRGTGRFQGRILFFELVQKQSRSLSSLLQEKIPLPHLIGTAPNPRRSLSSFCLPAGQNGKNRNEEKQK